MSSEKSLCNNWQMLQGFFPDGWERKAKELGALTRQRGIKDPAALMRILLIHLADGCSLRETVLRARSGSIAEISDVALFKRMKNSSRWLQWIACEMVRDMGAPVIKPEWVNGYNVRLIDATVITEPGKSGTIWRLHYSLQLFGLRCDFIKVTTPKEGESFSRIPIEKGDLLVGDRGYSTIKGMNHVISQGGDVIVRLRNKSMAFKNMDGSKFILLDHFSQLQYGQIGHWNVKVLNEDQEWIKLRLIAVKKSPAMAEYSMKKAMKEMKKKQRTLDPVTLELYQYFFIITSVPEEKLIKDQVLLLYQVRWQIELAFKRLKSIMGLGHLPKYDDESAKAWIHGKLVVAFLAQSIMDNGYFFSPWGYILCRNG